MTRTLEDDIIKLYLLGTKLREIASILSIENSDVNRVVYGSKRALRPKRIRRKNKEVFTNKQNKDYIREQSIYRKYNLTSAEYNEMFISCAGMCNICGIHQSLLKRRLSIDHCHKTGKIRGLLCHYCNAGLGLFKDNIDVLAKAQNYLINNY